MSQMKFRIGTGPDAKDYDAEAALEKVSLATLYELKVRTGLGIKSLVDMAKRLSEFQEDPMQLLEDKEAFQAFRVVIWLARKHAGEKNISIDDATNFPLNELFLYSDEEPLEEQVTPDPKADSGAAGSAVAAAPVPTTT